MTNIGPIWRLSINRTLLLLLAVLTLIGLGTLFPTPAAAQEVFEPRPMGLVAEDGVIDLSATNVRNVELLNRLPGGYANAVNIHQGYTYVSLGNELAIFDVQDPSRPTFVSFLSQAEVYQGYPLPYLFLNDQMFTLARDQLLSLSLADPIRPVQQESTPLTSEGEWAWSLAGEGAYLYAGFSNKFWIMETQPDGSVEKRGTWFIPTDIYTNFVQINHIKVDQQIAYVNLYVEEPIQDPSQPSSSRYDLAIVNVSDPLAPQLITILDEESIQSFWLTPQRLYAFANWTVTEDYGEAFVSGWIVYDRTNPHELVELTRLTEQIFYPTPSTIVTDSFILSWEYDYFYFLDLSDLANPTTAYLDLDMPVNSAKLVDGLLYVVGDGMRIYDAQALPELKLVGAFNGVLQQAERTLLQDNYLYILGHNGLEIFELLSPVDLLQIAHIPRSLIQYGNYWKLQDDILYLSDNATQLMIDVSDPARPAIVGFHDSSSNTFHTIAGNIAYYSRYNQEYTANQLILVETRNPVLWEEVGAVDLPSEHIDSIVVNRGRAYIAVEKELVVVNVADPTAPRVINRLPDFKQLSLHLATEDTLFANQWLDSGSEQLLTFDISNRDLPVIMGRFQIDPSQIGTTTALAYEAPFLYMTQYAQGLYILDATVLSLLLETGRYKSSLTGWDISVSDKRIGMIGSSGGFSLYRFTPPDETRRVEADGGTLTFTQVDDASSAQTKVETDGTTEVAAVQVSGTTVRYTLPDGFASTPISLTYAPRTLPFGVVSPPLTPTSLVFRTEAVEAESAQPVTPGSAYTLTIHYEAITGPFPAETLALYRWNGTGWDELDGEVDVAVQTVTATTDALGIYALMAEPFQLRLPLLRQGYHFYP